MALEPRILYDGAGAVAAADGVADSTTPQTCEPIETHTEVPAVSGQEHDTAPVETSTDSTQAATDAEPVGDTSAATDQSTDAEQTSPAGIDGQSAPPSDASKDAAGERRCLFHHCPFSFLMPPVKNHGEGRV